MKKFLALILMIGILMTTLCSGALAVKKGDVLKVTYAGGGGRAHSFASARYVSSRDIFVSKTRVEDRFVCYLSSAWAKRDKYTESAGATISISGSKEIASILNLGGSFSISKNYGSTIPANPNRESRLVLRCDYYKVVYQHVKYDAKGNVTGKQNKEVYIPIRNTQSLVPKYR